MGTDRKPNTAELLPLDEYDLIIVSYSGGKDSLACLLHLIDLGAPRENLELWHQCVDGQPGVGEAFMDWPVTESYVRSTGEAFGIPVRLQWKVGGFQREMLRDGTATATVGCELRDGETVTLKPGRGGAGTRRMFPQVSSDHSVRWCSSYLKIDVCSRAIANDAELKDAKILIVTGERAEESAARAKYATIEAHRCNTKTRTVHQWRPVADWTEQQIWTIIEKHDVMPHPAYQVGFGRVSCMACIFGDHDQWATVREMAPGRFAKLAEYEQEFGKTIRRDGPIGESADKGQPYAQASSGAARVAMSDGFTPGQMFGMGCWKLPAGAYKKCGGPS